MAPTTAFLLHPASALHDTGWGHPEHQGRLRALASTVGRDMIALHGRAEQVEAPTAEARQVLRVHTEGHLERVRRWVERAGDAGEVVELDPSPQEKIAPEGSPTRVSGASLEAALGNVGGVLEACRAVAAGRYRNAFVACRPPGHHATPDEAMGFCLFNQVAVGARWLQEEADVERVLIVDWDVHHGNGTQDAFWEDDTVFFLSLHLSPHWPGTGREDETGAGRGAGFTRNVELAPATPREAHLERFEAALDDAFGRFDPDFVLVSSGFDALAGDPLGGLSLEPEDFHRMTRSLMARADAACGGRLVACLEGGYEPRRTGLAAVATVRALAGIDEADPTLPA